MKDIVMLATDWDPSIDPTGMWMSEKFDGVLALWDGRRFVSRGGNTFNAPEWFTRHLPKDALLGELHAGRGKFNDVLSIVRRARPRDIEWARMSYRVFDAPDVRDRFEIRLAAACHTILAMQDMWRGDERLPPFVSKQLPVIPVKQELCESPAAFDAFHARVVAAGGEGSMLRRPKSPYRPGRSADLLRRKDWFQEEAIVISHNVTPSGFRSLRCQLGNDTGYEFDVAAGLTIAQASDPPPVGSIVTVKYKSKTKSGSLREPAFIAVRDYE